MCGHFSKLSSPGQSLAGASPKKEKNKSKKPYDKPDAAAGPSTPKKKKGAAAAAEAYEGGGVSARLRAQRSRADLCILYRTSARP